MRTPGQNAVAEALALGRKKLGTLARALTGHCGLNKHNVKPQASGMCRLGIVAEETLLHKLCWCPALVHRRSRLLPKLCPQEVKYTPDKGVMLSLAATAFGGEI